MKTRHPAHHRKVKARPPTPVVARPPRKNAAGKFVALRQAADEAEAIERRILDA